MTTYLALLSLLLALAVGVWAWSLQREVDRLLRRLDRYNKALFDAADDLRALREELATTSAGLRVAMSRQAGNLRFEPETTLREALLVHPQVQEVLAGFHLGGCHDCAVEPGDSLRALAQHKGIPLDKLLGTLNLLVPQDGFGQASNGNGVASPAPVLVRLPNVSLDFEQAVAAPDAAR